MKSKIIFVILLCFSLTSRSQNVNYEKLDSLMISISGEIKLDTILNQYPDSSKTDPSISFFGFCSFCNDSIPLFRFKKMDKEKKDTIDLILLRSDSTELVLDTVISDNCQEYKSFMSSDTEIKKQIIELQDWIISSAFIENRCNCTQYYTLELSNSKGSVVFKNINNFDIYKVEDSDNRQLIFYITSTRFCDNSMMIFRVKSQY